MKHGVPIPQHKRPGLALKAYRLRLRGLTFDEIAADLDVSQPTARNLVGAGQQAIEAVKK